MNVRAIVSILLIILLAVSSLARNSLWSDDLLLWGDTVRKSPNRGRPNYEYGSAWSRAGEADVAIEYIRRARSIDPSYFNQGLGMAMERGVDIRVKSPHGGADRAVPYRPPDPYAAIEQLVREGRTAVAIKAYEDVLNREPNIAEVHNRLGRLYFIANRTHDAVRELQTAIKLSPNLSAAHSNLGFIYLVRGNTGEAIAEFQEAIRLDPLDAEPRAKLGRAYLMSGRSDEAVRELEEAFRMNPQNSTARTFLPQARKALAKQQQ